MGSGSKRLIIVAIVVLSVVPALIGVGVVVVGALERLAEPPEGGGRTLGAPSREQSATPLTSSRPRRAIAPPPRTFSPLPKSTSEVVATFPAALPALRRRLGPTTQLTSVTVNEVSVLFAYRRGRSSRAGVLRWRPERRALEPANSAFSRVGSASDAAYPMAAVRAGVPRG